MKKNLIFAGILIIGAVAGWEFRDLLPIYPSAYLPKDGEQQASAGNGDVGGNRSQGQRGRHGAGAPPPAVKTVAAKYTALPMDVTAAGSADADENTTIAAQEQGLIVSITPEDGASVKAGDLIAKLDDRTAKAALAKDQALLVRDQATLTQAETALARADNLVERNAGTQQAADEARAARDTAAATVDADRAAISADQVVVENTEIRAPFEGRLGNIAISLGAFVNAGSTIVTIEKYDPIYVQFHLPETYLGQLKQGIGAGTITVDAVPQSGGTPVKGALSFFDNTVDPASGTILAKAKFGNPAGAFWPGQSANVTVHFQSDAKDVVVPTVAINPGADRPFVYTVGGDGKAHMKPVTVARSNGADSAITSGLAEGTHVVIEGQAQLVDGVTVTEKFSGGPTNQTASVDGNDRPIEVGAAQ